MKKDIFIKLKDLKVLVIGDIILDKYLFTKVDKMSYEAPVPIANLLYTKNVLGGAANLALNYVNLGAQVSLVSLLGVDKSSVILRKLLDEKSINFIPILSDFETVTKTRILYRNEHLLRVDRENNEKISEQIEKITGREVAKIIDDFDLVVIADYSKGFITTDLINYIKSFKKYMVISTNPKNFVNFKGFSLLKTNIYEAEEFAKLLGDKTGLYNNDESVEKLGLLLKKKLNINILINRNKDGVTFIGDELYHKKLNCDGRRDITGLSDSSFAIFSLMHYLKEKISFSLDNTIAAVSVTASKIGTYAPRPFEIKDNMGSIVTREIYNEKNCDLLLEDLKEENKRIVFAYGCFDELNRRQVSYLNKAKSLGCMLVVGIFPDNFLRETKNEQDMRGYLVSNLKVVDCVVLLDGDSLNLIKRLKPDYVVKTSSTVDDDVKNEILNSYGGKMLLFDYDENGESFIKVIK